MIYVPGGRSIMSHQTAKAVWEPPNNRLGPESAHGVSHSNLFRMIRG